MGKGDNYNIFFKDIKNKIDIIFEIGSRDGLDAITLYKYFNASDIYIFEANSELIQLIKKNTLKYDFKIENYAVYITDGETKKFYVCLSNIGASSLLGKIEKEYFINTVSKEYPIKQRMRAYKLYQNYKIIKTQTMRLDTYCNNNKIKNIDLLCIDVEGVGLQVIKSLGKYITDIKYIICEYNKTYGIKDQDTFEEIDIYLSNNNFTLKKKIEKDIFLGDALWINKEIL